MGYYNVIQPCVVGKLHYVRPTVQPIDVDDETAAPLVESGVLAPYRAGVEGLTGTVLEGALHDVGSGEGFDDDPPTDPPPARKPRARRD